MTSDTDQAPIRNDRPGGRLTENEVPDSPGARLRQTRQVKKLDINSVATALHLSRPVVEAIERNDYDHLPSAVFVAGYIRSYARLLGLDPEPLNESFRRLHPGAEAPPRQVGRGGRDGGERERSNLPLYLFLLVLLLAIGAGVYAWWMNQPLLEGAGTDPMPNAPDMAGRTTPRFGATDPIPGALETTPSETIASPPPASALDRPADAGLESRLSASDEDGAFAPGDAPGDALGDAPDDALGETGASTTAPSDLPAPAADDDRLTPAGTENSRAANVEAERRPLPSPPAPERTASSDQGLQGTQPEEAFASADRNGALDTGPEAAEDMTTADAGADVGADAETGSEPGAGKVVLSFAGPCWVDVRDATGEVLLFGEMSRGDREALDGEPPYSLVLGNAAAVEVSVGGQPYDIRPLARGNVARFELDPADVTASATERGSE